MNKVILMGRLAADPDVRYSQSSEPTAIVRIRLAVDRRFKRENEPSADFFSCVAFGKTGEFISKYFSKGRMISIAGRLSNNSWQDKTTGQNRTTTEVIIEEAYFCGSKGENGADYSKAGGNSNNSGSISSDNPPDKGDFYKVDQSVNDDDLPF